MLDLDLLRTLVCVVDEGSFTRAAQRVHRTQSTVSQQIAKLERIVGRPLLLRERADSSVVPTEDGELMLAYARRLVNLATEAEHMVTRSRAARVVRLGVPEDFDVQQLTVVLAAFTAKHAEVRLETVSAMSSDLRAKLDADELDLALIKREPTSDVCLASWPERLTWVGDRKTVVHGEPVPLVLFPQGCIYRNRMIQAMEARGWAWRTAYHSHSLAGIQAAVAAGLGISLLPAFARLKTHRQLTARDGFALAAPAELAIIGGKGVLSEPERRLVDALKQAMNAVNRKGK